MGSGGARAPPANHSINTHCEPPGADSPPHAHAVSGGRSPRVQATWCPREEAPPWGWVLACSPPGSEGLTQVVSSRGPARDRRAPKTLPGAHAHGHHARGPAQGQRGSPGAIFPPQGTLQQAGGGQPGPQTQPGLVWTGPGAGLGSADRPRFGPEPWLPSGSLCPGQDCPQHRARPASQRCPQVSTGQRPAPPPAAPRGLPTRL